MEVLDYFKTPKTAQLNQRIFVKEFVSLSKVEGKEKTLIEKNVSNIHLVDIYNEDRTGIWQYKDDSYFYEEILLFHLVVKDKDKVKQLNEEIQKLFPNPIIIIYQFNEDYMISTALKRLNKVEKDKTVIDSIQTTDWFKLDSMHNELLSRISFDKKNLKEFYESIDYILSAEYVALITKKVPEVIDFTIKAKSLMIQELLVKKKELEEQEKEESSMQGKMQCHMQIKAIEDKLKKIN